MGCFRVVPRTFSLHTLQAKQCVCQYFCSTSTTGVPRVLTSLKHFWQSYVTAVHHDMRKRPIQGVWLTKGSRNESRNDMIVCCRGRGLSSKKSNPTERQPRSLAQFVAQRTCDDGCVSTALNISCKIKAVPHQAQLGTPVSSLTRSTAAAQSRKGSYPQPGAWRAQPSPAQAHP